MSQTRTGNLTIGLRRMGGWQANLENLLTWARANGFGALDLGRDGDTAGRDVLAAGLRIGSVDLAEWHTMLSPDKGRRQAAVAHNAAYIEACAAYGPVNHFIVMLPEDPARPRAENFSYMVESFAELAPVMERHQARLVIEGWPGPGALCCTPEGYRAFFKEVPSPAMGINYDPSHLIRMGIDPLRFACEFSSRIFHIHGKDCDIPQADLYEYGHELPPIFGKTAAFGGIGWRYTIPGHGRMQWIELFQLLAQAGYAGCVSIELEDADFNGKEETEQRGLTFGRAFLESC